jgi:predicted nucleic acid-binding protein
MNDDRDRPFLDTNILVYTVAGPPEKSDKSEKILSQRGVISVQVLSEFTAIARRKYHFSWPELHPIVESFQNFLEIVPLTTQTHQTAVNLAGRYNLAFYDAVIAAAHIAGCTILYSEDMNHTLLIENRLRVANPFAA